MRYLINAIYLIVFAVIGILAIPFPTMRRHVHAFTRNFWGKLIPQLDGRPVVWVHAISVGETLVCRPLLKPLRDLRPDLQFVLSVGTPDGMAVALRELPETSVFYAPFDFSWSVSRVFDALEPQSLLIAENDFWPNMLNEAMRRNVPLAVFNSRMSLSEQQEHRWDAWFLRPGLQRARWWGAVTEQDAAWIRHFFRVQSPPLETTGSLKFEGVVRNRSNPSTEKLRQQFGFGPQDRIVVAGSTHQPEEEMLVEVVKNLSIEFPQIRLVLAPLTPSRSDVIARMLRGSGVHFVLASDLAGPSKQSAFVTLIDSIGLLRDAWGLADFAFVGGSLARHGGHNMIEPASYGIPVCFGPHVWNFQSIIDDLLEARAAVMIDTVEELEQTIRGWLHQPHEAEQLGLRAQELVMSRSRPIEQSVRGILSILPQACCATPTCQAIDNKISALQIVEAP